MPRFSLLFIISLISTIQAFSKDVYESKPKIDLFGRYIKKIACAKDLEKKIGSNYIEKQWVPILISEPAKKLKSGIVFRNTKTNKAFKVWGDRKSTNFLVIDKNTNKSELYVWSAATNCEIKTKVEQFESGPTTKSSEASKDIFTDSDLFQTLQNNKWGVVYVWTPYMPLSVQGLIEIKKAVASAGGKLTVLLDPKANLLEAEKWVEKGLVDKSELKKVSSSEILDRGLGVHYPAAYFYKDSFLSNADYVGYKKAEIYSKWFKFEKEIIDKDIK